MFMEIKVYRSIYFTLDAEIKNMNDGGELTMLNDIKIKNTDGAKFAVFCIENIAMSLKKMVSSFDSKKRAIF